MTGAAGKDTDATVATPGRLSQNDRLVLVGEVTAIVALTVADALGLVPLSRTPFLLLLCWVSLRLRGLAWRDIGFARPPRMLHSIAAGIVAGIGIELFAISVTTPWIASLTGTPPDVSDLQDLVGSLELLLLLLVASWILAAFGEEIAFRGYLMTRCADGLGGTRVSWCASLVVVSVYFGVGHGYQGVAGILQESLSGMWLGVFFLASGRNLTVPIVAHGASNTLALVLIYGNHYPGLA